MNTKSRHNPPVELAEAHDFYNHALFNKASSVAPPVTLALQEAALQKFKTSPKTILAVMHHNLELAYPRLFAQAGMALAKQWVDEFYRSGFSKSLVIHKQVDDFFYFLQIQPDWQALFEEENLIYQLLYAADPIPIRHNPPDPDASLLSCQLVWKTPWRVHQQKLWFPNPQTLLVEALETDTPQFWHCFAKSNPTLAEAIETALDQIEGCDTNQLLESVIPMLHELLRRGVVDLKQADQS